MGGFFYAKKEQAEDLDMFERRHAVSLACFRQKGMRCETKITRNDFSIFVFQKVRLDCENFLEFENGEIITFENDSDSCRITGGPPRHWSEDSHLEEVLPSRS